MGVDAANISSGIGLGEAQVFTPYESNVGVEVAKIRKEKRAESNKREADVYSDLGKVNTSGIFFKHQPLFAEKQKEIYDWTKQNIDALRKGDNNAQIEFRNKLSQLGTDIGLSKGVSESYSTAQKDNMTNPDKYRPETRDALMDFQGYDPKTKQFQNVDSSIMKQQTDLNKDFNQKILPGLEKSVVENRTATNQGNGVITTDETKVLTPDVVKSKIDTWVSDPIVHEQAYYNYKKEHPDSEPTLNDLKDDLYDKYGKTLVKDEHKRGRTEGFAPKDGAGNEKVTASDITDISYTTPNPKAPGGVETVTTRGFTLPSNVALNVDSDIHVIDRSTKKSLKDGEGNPYVGQLDIKGGSVGLDRVISGGKTTYVPMLFGTSVNKDGEKIDVQIPLSKVRGQKILEKYASGAADALQKQADDLNKGKEAKSGLPKKGDTKQFKEGLGTFNGTKWVLSK